MKRRSVAALTTAWVLFLGTAVSAEEATPEPTPPPEASDGFDEVVAQAVEAYGASRHDEAIRLFTEAYEIRPQSELIYNIARVYERDNRCEGAIEHYDRFLGLPNTTADLRLRATRSLEALRELCQPDEPPPPEDPPPPPPPVPTEPRDPLGPAGWAVLGLGGAALIAGAIFGGLALSEETATNEAGSQADWNLHFDRGETFALTADVLFGVGGAMALTGVILLIVRASRNGDDETEEIAEEEQVSWTPVFLGAQGLGFSVAGRF